MSPNTRRGCLRAIHASQAWGPSAFSNCAGGENSSMLQCVRPLQPRPIKSRLEFLTLPTAALPHDEIERWATAPLPELMAEAARLRDLGHGNIVSYSRKVFIPLTRLCRDTCRYCTFVRGPRGVASAYLSPDEVLAIARAGARAGCQEALFTLGDKPELRYEAARRRARRGSATATTIDYLAAMCRAGAARDRAAAARQSRRDERGRHRRAAPGVGVAGHHAGERVAAAGRARRAAFRLARQGAGGAARDHRGGGPARACRSPPAS